MLKKLTVDEAIKALRNDEVIAIPTDTVYGVCARMNSRKAMERLVAAKNRPSSKAFPLMCSDVRQVEQIAQVDEVAARVLNGLMPGPLTVVLRKKDGLGDWIAPGMASIAVRLATSQALQQIIDELGEPVFMTSANQSGMAPCCSAEEIEEQCPLAYGIVEGEVPFGQASTIVDLTESGFRILREGPVSMNTIKEVANA